ncbi:ABC transporter substrate-binding protein [Pseudonocardia xinjiangensis]|uniref:ABC transporter substrate-binding protein n=1 Tax=Pseudonocardia xinjiangensis TaxID=75289 RepID=A0ABX1RBI7_9PSEU|nr:ABC transporter substrate-binding protein [Pseudonocardia xinjiangensis]NMH76475.1 ABC transporter substrate-binding protein [Pseudonocardia xinjiangensis]
MTPSRTVRHTAPVVALSLLLVGCGAEVVPRTDAPAPVTVARCGEEISYQRPQRAVAYEAGSADKLFSLGLTDAVRGYVMPPANPPVEESPWAAEYAQVELLSRDLLNRELVVDAGADLVVAGWRSGFSDQRGITPEILDGLGIQSFMHTETCYNYPNFPEHLPPFEALYTDLDRLGRIFGVEERASAYIAELQGRVAAVRQQAPRLDPPPSVFLYDSGTDRPFTAASQVPPNQIIEFAGARNIFADLSARWTDVGWEAVVQAQPEIIVILDYQDQPAEEKIAFLKAHPALQSLPAIRHNRFHILDYNEAISGPRIVDGAERFAEYMHSFRR